MDNFSAHTAAVNEINEEGGLSHIRVFYLPANSTSHSQPLDQGIIANFKAIYRRSWLSFLLEYGSNNPLEKVTVLHAIRWSIQAWNDVTSKTITNCWRHSALGALQATARDADSEHESVI